MMFTIAQAKIGVPLDVASIKTNHKKDDEFRVYDEATSEPRVVQHYKDMRMFQTVEFYRRMEEKYSFANGRYRRLMTIEEAFVELENYIVSHVHSTGRSRVVE